MKRLACILILLMSCNRQSVDPEQQSYVLSVPDHFPKPVDDPENPLTADGTALGRMLFYDTRLSGNNKISCASCHHQALAFSDGLALSNAGVSQTRLLRHAPALMNLAWANNGLFWDGGSTNLESQAFGPLTAHDEMGQDLHELATELEEVPKYVSLFRSAFNDNISSANIVKALAQFQRTLVSGDSRYDQVKLNRPGSVLTVLELKGMNLVKQKCQGCHAGELFTDNDYHNNGLNNDFNNQEHEGIFLGRYRITYLLQDIGSFKTPTLRNAALTAPYMHDGRFATLTEVLDHYSDGILAFGSLDKTLPADGMKLTRDDKKAMIAFLETLTDHSFITNPAFQAP